MPCADDLGGNLPAVPGKAVIPVILNLQCADDLANDTPEVPQVGVWPGVLGAGIWPAVFVELDLQERQELLKSERETKRNTMDNQHVPERLEQIGR